MGELMQCDSEMEDPFENLCWTKPGDSEYWQVHGIIEANDPKIPQLTCPLFASELPGDHGLRRCELYCAALPMAGRFRDNRFKHTHKIIPVCVTEGLQGRKQCMN